MIPRPNKRVTDKEKANLKPGHGGRTKKTKHEKEISALAKKLLSDPWYKRKLIQRLREGTIQPGVESMLYQYAYGKPVDRMELTGNTAPPVKIIFETDEPEKCPPKPKKK